MSNRSSMDRSRVVSVGGSPKEMVYRSMLEPYRLQSVDVGHRVGGGNVASKVACRVQPKTHMSSVLSVFASHDWGRDQATHAAVKDVVERLRKRSVKVWFDETHMRGNILQAMTRGIDSSDVILVFITQNYIDKVNSDNDSDNVRREFMYASQYADKMIPVRFDCNLPSKWKGPVGMLLQSRLYTDLTTVSDKNMDNLVEAIRHATPRTQWKMAAQKITGVCFKVVEEPKHVEVKGLVTKECTTRDRVRKLAAVHGLSTKDEHTVETVERLLLSFGIQTSSNTGLMEKIRRLEEEMKLA